MDSNLRLGINTGIYSVVGVNVGSISDGEEYSVEGGGGGVASVPALVGTPTMAGKGGGGDRVDTPERTNVETVFGDFWRKRGAQIDSLRDGCAELSSRVEGGWFIAAGEPTRIKMDLYRVNGVRWRYITMGREGTEWDDCWRRMRTCAC